MFLGTYNCQAHNSKSILNYSIYCILSLLHIFITFRIISLIYLHKEDKGHSSAVPQGQAGGRKDGLQLHWGIYVSTSLFNALGFAGLLLKLKEMALGSAIHSCVPGYNLICICRFPEVISQLLSSPLETIFLHYSVGLQYSNITNSDRQIMWRADS